MLDFEVNKALTNPGNTKITPGIARIKEVLTILNNPQHKYKIIHIAGTNGKGSTAAFIESGLTHAGKKVGKFTSPYIKSINETIQLNHKQISDDDLNRYFYQIKPILEKDNIELSPFELLTVIMFCYFAEQNIEYLILEAGLGGRDDATNVVDSIISIITNISLEHTQYLGNNLKDIASHKAGIIKNGYTIIADSTPELMEEVKKHTNNYVNVLDKYQYTVGLNLDKVTTNLQINDTESYCLSLFGKFQAKNFLCAYEVLLKLGIYKDSIKFAAENTYNQGRLEIYGRDPLILLDAAHNAAGVRNLVDSLFGHYKADDVVLIVAILKDKDQKRMLEELSKLSQSIVCTEIKDNPRNNNIKELAKLYFKSVLDEPMPKQALEKAKQMDKKLVLITGSIYLLGHFC